MRQIIPTDIPRLKSCRNCPAVLSTGPTAAYGLALFFAAIPAAFWLPEVSMAIYVLVALIRLVPGRRIERVLVGSENLPSGSHYRKR